MGFLSGITQALTGGSQSSSSGTSGFSLLPPEIQQAYTNYGSQVNNQLQNGNLTQAYTPLPQTAGETQAYGAINQGFTPTQQSLTSDINMQMNPYDSSVLDQIQRQAYGQNSALNSATTAAGQYGSNRQALGANDIANSQASTIGSVLGGEYNTALQNALTTLPGLRQQDAQAQLSAGANQRTLAGQTAQAPVNALQQIGAALGILPTSGGSQQSSQSTASNGLFPGGL